MFTLFRDDDICKFTNITLLMQVHELFIKHNRTHTIAVLMENIWDNKEVWHWMMTAPKLEIGLHGWEHSDYSVMSYEDICSDIERSFMYWRQHLAIHKTEFRNIKKFFPPWNRVSPDLQRACDKYGLELDSRIGGEVYNFHYWCMHEKQRMEDLERALNK